MNVPQNGVTQSEEPNPAKTKQEAQNALYPDMHRRRALKCLVKKPENIHIYAAGV